MYSTRPKLVLCLALITIWRLPLPAAHADVIQYVMSSGASTTWGGDVEAISGTFTYNTTIDLLLAVDISLAGALENATYTVVNAGDRVPGEFEAATDTTYNDEIVMGFVAPLSNAPDDLWSTGHWSVKVNGDEQVYGTASTGFADPVPEPSSLALLGITLGIFALIHALRRLYKRDPGEGSIQTLSLSSDTDKAVHKR